MDDDKIREAAEKLEAQCAAVACDGSAHTLSWAVIDTVLRTLVADTARRCAEIAQEQARRDEGAAMQLEAAGHDLTSDRAKASAAYLREVWAVIRKEFGIAD